MPRFCHQCGHRNEDTGTFCEECGTPLRKPQPKAAQPAAASTPPAKPLAQTAAPAGAGARPARPALPKLPALPKPVLFGALGVAVLLVGGGLAAALLIGGSKPTESVLRAASASWLETSRDAIEEPGCLRNFDYSDNPVHVSPWNQGTLNWLNALVEAGIYTGGETVTTGGGFYRQQQVRYTHGPEAARYIRGSRLCGGERMQITALTFDPETTVAAQDTHWVRGTVTLEWTDRAPWTQHKELANSFTQAMQPRNETVAWKRIESGDWQQVTATAYAQAVRSLAATDAKQNSAKSSGGSSGGWFGDLFGGPGPEKIVEGFYKDLEAGRIENVLDAVSLPPQLNQYDRQQFIAMFSELSEELINKGGIASIKTERGPDLANGWVQVIVHAAFRNGETERETIKLRKIDGKWKMSAL
jgi:hypothetical protein